MYFFNKNTIFSVKNYKIIVFKENISIKKYLQV